VTAMSRASSLSLKIKIKRNSKEKKYKIKEIDRRKRKMLVSKAFYNRTQDWEEFVQEIKTTFSDKMKAANAKWKIETFKQEKKNIADFMIEFNALAIKMNTDKLHAIFLLKKNV